MDNITVIIMKRKRVFDNRILIQEKREKSNTPGFFSADTRSTTSLEIIKFQLIKTI